MLLAWYMPIDSRIPRIRVAGHNSGNSAGTSRLAGGDKDQQLHKKVVHVRSTRGL